MWTISFVIVVFLVIFLLKIAEIEGYHVMQVKSKNSEQKLSRQKRLFPEYGPYFTGWAIGVAAAFPVDNGRGDIFETICFQANYNQPNYEPVLTPALFQVVCFIRFSLI